MSAVFWKNKKEKSRLHEAKILLFFAVWEKWIPCSYFLTMEDWFVVKGVKVYQFLIVNFHDMYINGNFFAPACQFLIVTFPQLLLNHFSLLSYIKFLILSIFFRSLFFVSEYLLYIVKCYYIFGYVV